MCAKSMSNKKKAKKGLVVEIDNKTQATKKAKTKSTKEAKKSDE